MDQANVIEIPITDNGRIISRAVVSQDFQNLPKYLEPYDSIYVVYDKNITSIVEQVLTSVTQQVLTSVEADTYAITATEQAKSIDTVMGICRWLMDAGADRKSLLLAVGGGITTDMAGFAASIYKRGISFAYVSTTLLAQVDAGIGGKTGVNLDTYKNMVGVIRQPVFTYIPTSATLSLPSRDFHSGLAEMLKTFIIADQDAYFAAVNLFSHNERNQGYLAQLTELVAKAVAIKAGIVSRDQFESGERRKLNLGHTFAHAIEALSRRFDEDCTHGEAVSMGIILAAQLADSFDRKVGTDNFADKLRRDFSACGLPVDCNFSIDDMADAMKKDKKADGAIVHFVLPFSYADVRIVDISVAEALARFKA